MRKIKICGLSRQKDIETVNIVKPDYCGFIIDFPKSRRNVSAETVRQLCSELSGDITPVGVFVDAPVQTVAGLLNDGTVSVAQLHGHEDEDYIAALRSLTDKTLWQAFQVSGKAEIESALASSADFVLLDAGQGSGRAFDWSLIDNFPRAFGLGGGLNSENVSDAMETSAVLLDVSGGVETDGYKDAEKIKEFVGIVRDADRRGI